MEVWISVGDSEMQGSGLITEMPGFFPPADGTLYMVRDFAASVTELAEPGPGGVGPDGMFAWYRQRQIPTKKVLSVQCGVSGTNSTHYLPDVNPVSMHQKVIAAAALALSQPGAYLGGFLLYGGANDGSLGSPAWGTNWTTTFTAWRAAIAGAASVPILYAQLPAGTPHVNYSTSWNTVRTQQAAWAAADRIMFVVDPAGPWGNGAVNNTQVDYLVHQAAPAAAVLAQQFAGNFGAIPAMVTPDLSTVSGTVLDAATIQQTSGAVDAIADTIRAKSLVGTGTARPTYSASDATWNSLPSATFDGSNDEMLYSGSLADWACLHNGLGGTLTITCRYTAANADLFTTTLGTDAGLLLRFTGGSLLPYCYVGGGALYNGNTPRTVPINTKLVVQYRMQTGTLQTRTNGGTWTSAPFFNPVSPSLAAPTALKLGHQFYRFAGTVERVTLHSAFLSNLDADKVAKHHYLQYGF
jgi:hypothetical protein